MSKKFTLFLIFNLAFIIFNVQKAKAQYVTIPDANFASFLTTYYPSCMSGNQMDTTCNGIVNAANVNVSGYLIANLSGIQYFDNLTYLSCSNTQITNLPALPNSLIQLICSFTQLTSLPPLPNSLETLYCPYNQLTSLPALPNSLKNLDCNHNYISTLPTLPNSMLSLNCSSLYQLFSLPILPNSLLTLNCSNNLNLILPTSFPNSLKNLYCTNCNLYSLSTLPNNLNLLACYNNNLSSLPALPDSLSKLYCDNNYLNILPSLPDSLKELKCNNNQLSSFPAMPHSLKFLDCSYNQLISLPALPEALKDFNCKYNQLNSLLEVPSIMNSFFINNNNISCVTNLPQVSNSTYGNISNNSLSCVPNQTNYSLGLPLCEANDVINNPNNCQSVVNVTGNVYSDLDSNCTYNTTDLNTQNIPIKLYDTQNNMLALSYTINGMYSFAALQPDSFQIKLDDAALPINMACSNSNTIQIHLDSTSQSIIDKNFAIVCDSIDNKVKSVIPIGWVFPGQVHTFQTNVANDLIWYNLNCASANIYSGTVSIQISGSVSYDTIANNALTPIINGNTFTYNIANFDSLTPHSFGLKLLTDTTAQIGDQICVHVTIATTPTDADTTNNEYDFCYNVVNSYDPNMKEVYPTNVLPGYDDWFTYTIHFQNTGTAPAFNIRLRDTLDTQLDINTFEFLGASHTANTSLNGNNLTVRFNNIMLPDSTSDYEGSMGYFQYRVKPLPNITNGSTIENTAYIYFDYNPAIITNTTQNNFEMPVGNRVIARNEAISIYPNPSTGIFTIKSANVIKTIEVFNLIGESVLQQTNGNTININNQPQGIYFCKVNGNSVVKLVKE